jgi:dienelactone hydrolase
MEIVEEVCERGVVERRVGLKVESGEIVPGIVWLPEAATGPRPTVILGHGGTVHKRAPEVLGLARRLVRHRGYAAVALDAPEHGERITDTEAARARRRSVQARIDQGAGAGPPVAMGANQAAGFASRMAIHVGELSTLVDDLVSTGFSDDRLGYWGLSMGTGIGLRFVASQPRIKAAVLGLAGLGAAMGGAEFETAARSLRVPILFLLQWDDELIARDPGLALFDAIGSNEKTLHVNPGGHVQVPVFENDSAESFFVRHLGEGGEP